MIKVAIITLNYNGKEDTLELLESLKLLATSNLEQKIIVVDNASEDGSVSEIRKKFPKVDIIQSGKNLGFSGGYNRGIQYAQIWGADYFLLINNDTLIKDVDLLSTLLKTIKSDKDIGLISPKIYFAKGFEFHKDKYAKEDQGKVIWFAGGKFDSSNIGNIHRGLDEVDVGQYDLIEGQEIFSGACVLIKKEVFEKVKGFDERYFLYFEDSDLAKRVTDRGFKIFYNGRVAIYHKVSKSTGVGSSLTDYYHTRNRLIFAKKYAKSRTKFALLRQAIILFLFGRAAQRKGIVDFLKGIVGGSWAVKQAKNIEYPLKLSIGIVNYNTPDLTKKLIDSIFRKDSGFNGQTMEIIVLDNGEEAPCKVEIREYLLAFPSGPKIKYLRNEENEGFSKGYNKTIKYSLGEHYLMLNSDIEVLPNGIKELVKWADDYQSKAVLGGKLVFPDQTDQDSVFHLPTISGAFEEYFLGKKGSYFMYLPKGEKPARVAGLVMACLLIPKKILERVGLLDEGTFIFFEDIEYASRLRKYKVPICFIPTAKFIHHHGASTKKIGQEKAVKLLVKSAKSYHGSFYYFLLSLVLRIGQKLGRVETPVSRWTKS